MAKRPRSPVWNYFKSEGSHALCNICDAKVSRGPDNYQTKNLTNTSLWSHLERKHKEDWIKAKEESNNIAESKKKEKKEIEEKNKIFCLKSSQPTLEAFIEKGKPWKPDSKENVS